MSESLLLPPGTRLVHIGPHKTGTTAVQWAFHKGRKDLAGHGVHYAGKGSQPYRAVVALTGRRGRLGAAPAGSIDRWTALVDEIDRAGDDRVVLSCESLANAATPAIERLADDLGRDRVHVVRMVRRYDKLLPSQWQQAVAGGKRRPYEAWLRTVLNNRDHHFWHRHGYRELTSRWVDVVGPENVTVVVVDETDRRFLLDTFEQLVGLPPQTLQLSEDRENRSLTLSEVELLRAFNIVMRARHWKDRVHHRYIRFGATPAMKRRDPDPGDVRLRTPQWAIDAAAREAATGVREIVELGVRVVGDLSSLLIETNPGRDGAGDDAPDVTVAPGAAAAATVGVIASALRGDAFPITAGPDELRTRPVEERPAIYLTNREIVGQLRRRATQRVTSRRGSRSV